MHLKNIPAIAVVIKDEDVLSFSKEELNGADIIELRVDMFQDAENIEDITKIFDLAQRKYDIPLLCTVRSPKEGGRKEIKNRLSIYEAVLPFCSFFDIEIFCEEVSLLKELVKKDNVALIGSYHNFKYTPKLEELETVLDIGKKLGIDIIKVATMVNDKKDLETLLMLTLKNKEDKIIVLGMGHKGIPSRIINPVFGSLITYVSLNEASAPGQLSLNDMVRIFRILGLRE